MTLAQAHATCLALLLVDFLARTWRMQWLLRGLGHRLPFWEVFVHSALGEAASSLSPFRLGGEPSRIWAMTRLGVPLTPAVVAIGVEIVAMTPVVLAGAAVIVLWLAPEWWVAAGPALAAHARSGGPWVVGVVVLTAVTWRLAHRAAPAAVAALRREIGAARAHVRELPAWPLVASLPMTALNVGARIAVLPVLASAVPGHPPFAALVVGSFALLYSQLILPTPAGAGAVDLGFLGGAAGELGPADMSLLVAWRFYTNGLGVALGLVLTAARYGAPALAAVLQRLRSGGALPGQIGDDEGRGGGGQPSLPRDPSARGAWQRVVRTGWTANAALAFVLVALAALATLPVLNARRAAPLNRELRDVIEPARGLVTQLHVGLAIGGAAIRDYRESGDTVFLSRYEEAYAAESAAYEQLSRLASRLGPEARRRFAQLRDLEQRWHAAITRSLDVRNRRAARSERPRPEDVYEELLVAAAHLDDALSQDARAGRQRLDDAERLQRRLAVILAMIAFAAGLGVAWLGQRVRVFAREAEQRRLELERATESRARLMRGISHDLKNPLGAIDGHAALLADGIKGPLNPQQQESLTRIRRSVRSLLMLINDLLELSRAEAGQLRIHFRCTDVADLVRDVVEEHRAAAEAAGHKLTFEMSDDLPPIETDAGRVRQILGNLLSNAVKYTPSGGNIHVRSGERTGNGRLAPGRWVAIDIADSGPGIPSEKLEEIFDEFSRLDPGTKPGAGLGLTIARRISRFLGGDVSVASRYGEGATFTLWLPVDRRGTDRRSVDRRRADRTGG